MQIKAMAFYWYPSEDDYVQMKSLSEDSSKLHDTFTEWRIAAEDHFKKFQTSGNVTVVKTEITTNEFVTWCNTSGRNINGNSRSDFANHKLGLLIKSGTVKINT